MISVCILQRSWAGIDCTGPRKNKEKKPKNLRSLNTERGGFRSERRQEWSEGRGFRGLTEPMSAS